MLQVSYLYTRMYYNKMRKAMHSWWHTYLLFKCCVLVVPIYTFLLLLGLYCIVNNIDVASSLKTCYELVLLILSAAAIFIVVLLLATLNGDHSRPIGDDEEDYYDDYEDHNLDSSTITTIPSSILIDGTGGAVGAIPSGLNGTQLGSTIAPPSSQLSNNRINQGNFGFMTTLFGNFNPTSSNQHHHRDDDYIDDIYLDQDDDLILNEMMLMNLMMLEGGQLPTSTDLSHPPNTSTNALTSNYHQLMSLSESRSSGTKLTIAPPLPAPLPSSSLQSSSSNPLSLNSAQHRLVSTMERTADTMQFFFDQCDSFTGGGAGDDLPAAQSQSEPNSTQYNSPPPGYFSTVASSSSNTPTIPTTHNSQSHLYTSPSLSSIQLQHNLEKPPSYEEAIQ